MAIGWARANGHAAVHLEVLNGNDRARRAYERNGFVASGPQQAKPDPPGRVCAWSIRSRRTDRDLWWRRTAGTAPPTR